MLRKYKTRSWGENLRTAQTEENLRGAIKRIETNETSVHTAS